MLVCLCSFQMDHFHPFKTEKRVGKREKKRVMGEPAREGNSKPSVDRIKAAL